MSTTVNNSTAETKVETKKFNLRDVAKRTDLFRMNPLEINVDWDSNPRKDYGADAFDELKLDISKKGVVNPIEVYVDKKDNSVHVAGGFRRMKAILALIEEGHDIPQVPILQVPYNREDILASHYTMNNTGLPMNEIEVAGIVEELYNLTGDYNRVAEKMRMTYQKVYKYVNFIKEASTLNKTMVQNKELSLANAMAIATQANGTQEQNEILTRAKESAKQNGHAKIKPTDIKGVKTQNSRKREDVVLALNGFIKFLGTTGVSSIAVEDLQTIVNALETGAQVDELIDTYIEK